jgi:hypothetical protein
VTDERMPPPERRHGNDSEYTGQRRRVGEPDNALAVEARRLIFEQKGEADRLAEERVSAAARLADERTERAANLAEVEAERRVALALKRQEIDIMVGQQLKEHTQRLDAINGSVKEQVSGLERVEDGLSTITHDLALGKAVTEAISMQVEKWNKDQTDFMATQNALASTAVSKKAVFWTAVGSIVAICAFVIVLVKLLGA